MSAIGYRLPASGFYLLAKRRFVEDRNPELLGLLQFGARFFTSHEVGRLLADRSRHLAAQLFYELRRLFPRERRQRAREDERLAGQRAGLDRIGRGLLALDVDAGGGELVHQ